MKPGEQTPASLGERAWGHPSLELHSTQSLRKHPWAFREEAELFLERGEAPVARVAAGRAASERPGGQEAHGCQSREPGESRHAGPQLSKGGPARHLCSPEGRWRGNWAGAPWTRRTLHVQGVPTAWVTPTRRPPAAHVAWGALGTGVKTREDARKQGCEGRETAPCDNRGGRRSLHLCQGPWNVSALSLSSVLKAHLRCGRCQDLLTFQG